MKSTPTNASTDGPLSYTSSDRYSVFHSPAVTFSNTDRPENPSTDTSRNTEPPRNLKAAGRVFITNPTAPLIGTFVIDPHKTAPRLPNYPSSPIQKKEPTNPLSQDRPNLHLVGTDDVIDVTVWLVESQVKISRTRTRIVMTQTKEQPITAQIVCSFFTPSSPAELVIEPVLSNSQLRTLPTLPPNPVHCRCPLPRPCSSLHPSKLPWSFESPFRHSPCALYRHSVGGY